jgi:hypothetical protein
MSDLRLLNISMVYYTISGLRNAGSSLDVINSLPDDPTKLADPIVALENARTGLYEYEIGSSSVKGCDFIVEAYLSSDGRRDDIGNLLFDHFVEKIIDVKDYNQGFPSPKGSDPEPDIIGNFQVSRVSMIPVYYDNENELAKHIMRINLQGILFIN